ncbi:MAG: energy-coupling factor transporter ATPase [Bacillota bacterium]
MSANMDMITAQGLGHRYKTAEGSEVQALQNVNLKVPRGQFVVIIGRNGSGKSTLAKHLNALLQPTEGRVLVNGIDTKDGERIWEVRQTAGMVFQNPDNQLVATTVEEDVAFGPENLGIPPADIRSRVRQSLLAVGMAEYAKHAPHLLSGGQKQRVAIAGILAMKPKCIILDEPTAMLDPSGREEVLQTVKKLNREGITVIHITHHMDEAVEADRVIVMDDGKVILDGSPRQVFRQVDKLKAVGLNVPQITELAQQLRNAGVEIADDILTIDEMVASLCPSS